MPHVIKEPDWKLFRELQPVALERFCGNVLTEIEHIGADTSKSVHSRYLTIYKTMERRDKEIAQTFNDLRRSTALFQIAAMKSHNVLTEEEFSRFSEETRRIITALLAN